MVLLQEVVGGSARDVGLPSTWRWVELQERVFERIV